MLLPSSALVEHIYRYYPRGIEHTDPRYRESEESLRLTALCSDAGTGASYDRFCAMLTRVELRVPGAETHNSSLRLAANGDESCYAGMLQLASAFETDEAASYYLGFRISLIMPVYTIYRAVRAVGPELRSWPIAEQLAYMLRRPFRYEFAFTPEEQPYADAIAAEVEATYTCELLLPEIGNIPVPDVDAQHGIGQETIYSCLFSGNW